MPIRHAIWKVGQHPTELESCSLGRENLLEDMIAHSPEILSNDWMIIGRQVQTAQGKFIDLLAIAPDGSLVVIEEKREKTPREVVAQAIDYASWVETLSADKIAEIFHRFTNGRNLAEAFNARFGRPLDEESLNESHQIVIVASELDDSSERIINYLNERDIPINVIFFQVFQCGEDQLLSRAWLIDPGETQSNVVATSKTKGEKEPWNGEFYVSFGDPSSRSWDEARKYGFVSAGGGLWYSQTLKKLRAGDRVWVNVPQHGYVGVGIVEDPMQSASEFKVPTEEGDRAALDVLQHADLYRRNADDPEKAEYFVRIRWLDTVPLTQAVREVGFFGNQNTLCQPVTPQWRATVERLKLRFPNWDAKRS